MNSVSNFHFFYLAMQQSRCGLDLVANGFGLTNSILLSGLLLSLPWTLLVAASPILDTACKYIDKKEVINLIEEQFRGDDKFIEVGNENPESFVAAGCFSLHQLAITYPQVSS